MWFGIPALVFTGMTWSFVGVVMGSAPKKGLQTSIIQFYGSLIHIIVSLAVLLGLDLLASATPEAIRFVIICCLISGVLNFILLELMSKAMQTGPNGIVWSIVQSGLIFPFTMGILFFGVPLNPFKIFGIISIITAMAIMGLTKNNDSQGNRTWLLFAFASFLTCGMQQSINSLPAYDEATRQVPSVLKTLMNSVGVAGAAFIFSGCRSRLKRTPTESQQSFASVSWSSFHNKYFWIFLTVLQGFGLVASYFLLYPGMDAMARANLGNVSYPLLVSSCIVGFFLYSMLILREKAKPMQYLGVALCLIGIFCICVKTADEIKQEKQQPATEATAEKTVTDTTPPTTPQQ